MQPARFVLLAVTLAAAASAQNSLPEVQLDLRTAPAAVEAKVHVGTAKFIAMVLVSSSPAQQHFFVGLPPILVDHAVLGIGITDNGTLLLRSPLPAPLPPGLQLYGQALVTTGLWVGSSAVATLHQ